MNSDDVRGFAYADLIAGLIDARNRSAEDRFDAELDAAEQAGRIDAETARTLRWWQRECVRAVVSQAEKVLPPTLQALESTALELRERTSGQLQPSLVNPVAETDDLAQTSAPPVDLTARRLLVAGLTPLRDP